MAEAKEWYVRIVRPSNGEIVETGEFDSRELAEQFAAHAVGAPGRFVGAFLYQRIAIAYSPAPKVEFVSTGAALPAVTDKRHKK